MSEHEPNLEVNQPHEKLVDPEHQRDVEKAIFEKAKAHGERNSAKNLELLQEIAKKQAEAQDQITVESDEPEPDALVGMQQEIKTTAYDRTLRGVRQKLPKPARLFSQVAHNKTVEVISETTAKTVARPSGLLGGSICAFVGSLVLLYYSKHYGFSYNYTTFLILFATGFVVGAIIELTILAVYRSKRGRY